MWHVKVPICSRPDAFYQQWRKNNKRPTFTEQLLWEKLWAWCFVNIIANPHIILAEWSILYPLGRYENSAPSRLKCTSIIQSVILGSRPNWFPDLTLSLSFSGRVFWTSINTHFDLWHLQKKTLTLVEISLAFFYFLKAIEAESLGYEFLNRSF